MEYNSDNVISLIHNRIHDKIYEYFPYLSEKKYEVTYTKFRGSSSYPIYIYQIKSSTGCVMEEIFVKFAPVSLANNEGETEYKWLKLLYPKLPLLNPNIEVPRPLDFYNDVNALLTVKVEGESFKHILLKYNSFGASIEHRKKLDYYINLCGQWLKIFHNLTNISEPKLLDDSFFQQIYSQLEKFQPYGFSQTMLSRLKNLQQNVKNFAYKYPMEIASQHGDFGPSNIIINKDHIYIIDLSYNRKESIYHDIACFLVGLQTINPMPRYPTYDYMTIKHFRNVFLQSYFGYSLNPIHELFIELYSLKAILMTCKDQYEVLNKWSLTLLKLLGVKVLMKLYSELVKAKIRKIEDLLIS